MNPDLRSYFLPVPAKNNVLPVKESGLPYPSPIAPQSASPGQLGFHLQTVLPTISQEGNLQRWVHISVWEAEVNAFQVQVIVSESYSQREDGSICKLSMDT